LIVDNCTQYYNIEKALKPANHHNVTFIKNDKIEPLTRIQSVVTVKADLLGYDYFGFSSDDVVFLADGFVEEAIEKMEKTNIPICSLTTARDPVAYIYKPVFYKHVGWDLRLKGKEATDVSLRQRVRKCYGRFPHIGKYWKLFPGGDWKSYYIHHFQMNEQNLNEELKKLGISAGDGNLKLIEQDNNP
jgi:hypothetical protein